MEKDPAISGDREQQRRDNIASRKQSGLEPLPQDVVEEKDAPRRDREGKDEADRSNEQEE